MKEIRFYHLQNQSTHQALPALIAKAHSTGQRIIIQTENVQQAEAINDLLWTFRPKSFLPHGTKKDGNAENQPIWITDSAENPNKASILIVTGGRESINDLEGITLQCEMFQGSDADELSAARKRWKAYKADEKNTTYWQQTGQGGWEQKA